MTCNLFTLLGIRYENDPYMSLNVFCVYYLAVMILLTICVWPTSGLSYETFQRDWKRKRSTWDNLLRFILWRQPDENNLYLTETEEYSVIFHSTLWFISAVYKGLPDAWSSFHLLSVITHTHYVLLDRGPVTLTLFSLELNRLTTLLMSVLWFLLSWEIMCWTTNIQSVGNIHDEVHKCQLYSSRVLRTLDEWTSTAALLL